MISQEQADACLAEVAHELMELSYDELSGLDSRLPRTHDSEWRELRQLTVSGEKLYVNILIGRLDYFRRRISVEMVLGSEGESQWPRVPCVYFERFKSGRLWVAGSRKWEETLFRALPYVVVGAVVLGLAVGIAILIRRLM